MKFATAFLSIFVALAAAAPATQPQEGSANIQQDAKLEARQQCSSCQGGFRNCCHVGGCTIVVC